jgi:hypothetical protein
MTLQSNPPVERTSLAEQRQVLRSKIAMQRQVIEQQLEPVASASGYPRSMTMRFLSRRSLPTVKILAGAATLLVGARFIKSTTAALALLKVLR